MPTPLIAPSILSADFLNLGRDLQLLNTHADWIHCDVMDGRFVPNITFGFFIIEQIAALARKPLDVHLMIEEPERYIERFSEAGADIITVHYEACPHLHRTLHQIRETGAKAGVALNPHTPVTLLEDLLEDIDLVLIMSVNPGFGGQQFIYRSIPRIRQLRERIVVRNTATRIEVDGGIGLQNAEKVLQAGADVLVAGSSIFRSDDPLEAIRRFKSIGSELKKFV